MSPGKKRSHPKKDFAPVKPDSEEFSDTLRKNKTEVEPETSLAGQEKPLSIDELTAKLAEKEKEIQELHDQLLRTMADFENQKKRVHKEKENLMRYGNQRLALEILPVIDSFERAITQTNSTSNSHSVLEGIELILKQLFNALEKFGIRSFESIGQPFDPQKHEAMTHQETTEQAEDTVISEFQKGYFLHDRLLRPALVAVAKRPASPAQDQENVAASDIVVNEVTEESNAKDDLQ